MLNLPPEGHAARLSTPTRSCMLNAVRRQNIPWSPSSLPVLKPPLLLCAPRSPTTLLHHTTDCRGPICAFFVYVWTSCSSATHHRYHVTMKRPLKYVDAMYIHVTFKCVCSCLVTCPPLLHHLSHLDSPGVSVTCPVPSEALHHCPAEETSDLIPLRRRPSRGQRRGFYPAVKAGRLISIQIGEPGLRLVQGQQREAEKPGVYK